MTKQQELINQLKALISVPVQVIPGEVTEVTEPYYCTVKPVNGPEIYEVRLRASNDNTDTGFIEVPKKNSTVLIGLIGNSRDNCFVVMCSEVDKVLMKIGQLTFELNDTVMNLNGDQFGGLVKVGALVQKLNAIETALNNHLTIYNAHTHAVPSFGTSATPVAPDAGSLTNTTESDLKNDNVKHG